MSKFSSVASNNALARSISVIVSNDLIEDGDDKDSCLSHA